MTDSRQERRRQQRITASVPVALKGQQGDVQGAGHTRDLSSNGIFLYTDSEIVKGSELEMVLILPPEFTDGEKRWVCCQASVVRVEGESKGGKFGVAAAIRSMQFLPEIPR